MNPWEIIGQDKPVPVYVDKNGKEIGDRVPTKDDRVVGYRYSIIYRNGRMSTYFRENGAPSDGSADVEESYAINPDIEKTWNAATKGESRKDVTESGGVRTTTVTPPGGDPRVVGTEPARGDNDRPGTTAELVDGPGGNTNYVVWELEPDGSKGRIVTNRPAKQSEIDEIRGNVAGKILKVDVAKRRTTITDSRGNVIEDRPATDAEIKAETGGGSTKQVERNGKVYNVSYDASGNEIGIAESKLPAEEKKPDVRTDKDGRPYELVRNSETGAMERVYVQDRKDPNAPSRSKFTGLSPERLAQSTTRATEHALNQIWNDDTIDDVEKDRRARAIVDYAKITLDEQQQLLASQQNSLSNRTTQRNQDMQDVQGRRNFAESIFKGGMGALANAGQFSEGRPEDTAKFVEGFKGYMAMAQDALARFGGDRYVPRAVPGAEQQRLDQLSMPAIVGAQQVPAFIAPTYTSVFAPQPAQFSPMPSVQVPVSMAQPQPQPVAVPVAAPQGDDEPIGMPRFMMLD